MSTATQLKDLLDKASNKLAEARGQQAVHMARLKELGCDTLVEAEQKCKELQADIDAREVVLSQRLTTLRERYDEIIG